MRNISKTFLLPIATLVVGVIGAISIHQALAGPSAAPPYNNVSSPVNVSANPQVKKGPLGLGLDLTTDKLGNQLRVKGTTMLEGKTTITGGASISGGATIAGNTTIMGTTNVVGDTYAKQFCLPDDKGGCVSQWSAQNGVLQGGSSAPDLSNYCTKNDTRDGCQGVGASYTMRFETTCQSGQTCRISTPDSYGVYECHTLWVNGTWEQTNWDPQSNVRPAGVTGGEGWFNGNPLFIEKTCPANVAICSLNVVCESIGARKKDGTRVNYDLDSPWFVRQ